MMEILIAEAWHEAFECQVCSETLICIRERASRLLVSTGKISKDSALPSSHTARLLFVRPETRRALCAPPSPCYTSRFLAATHLLEKSKFNKALMTLMALFEHFP